MAAHLPMLDFSFAAASSAAATCRTVAEALDGILDARAEAAARLDRVWRGRLHDEVFATTGLALSREGADVREDLLQTAAAIERAAEDAATENARRREVNRQRDLEEQRLQEQRLRALQGPR